MELKGCARLLRIFIGEGDKLRHTPLYEVIVREARTAGLAGATVLRGVLGFGHTSRIRTAKVMDLSTDLSMVIEIVDERARIDGFLANLHRLFDEAGCGGLVTLEDVEIIKYGPGAPPP